MRFVITGSSILNILNDRCRPLAYFEKYLKMGYYPFVLEGEEDYYERIANVANLILEIELPQLCGVDVANIRKLKSLLAVLASEIAGVTDSFIAANGIEHPFGNKIPLWCFGFLY